MTLLIRMTKQKLCLSVVHDNEMSNHNYCTACEEIAKTKLDAIRKAIKNENISYGEIAELQDLRKYIDKKDVLLLEWVDVK